MPVLYYLGVFDKNTNELVGYIADITCDGGMLLSEKPLKTGAVFQLKIESDSNQPEKDQIEFEAVCVRCILDRNLEYYDCGLKFLKIISEDVKKIELLIDKYGLDDN